MKSISFAGKTLSVILSFVLCFSLCPLTAYADTTDVHSNISDQELSNSVESGSSDNQSGELAESQTDSSDSENPEKENADSALESEPQNASADGEAKDKTEEPASKTQTASDLEESLTVNDLKDPELVEFEQEKNSTNIQFNVPKAQEILDSKLADKVSIEAKMAFNGKITRSASINVDLEDLVDNGSQELDFAAYGKYEVTVTFLKGNDKVSSYSSSLGVVAEEYNIATLCGTMPALLFSLQIPKIATDSSPAMVLLERPAAYNWNSLPSNVYPMPTLTEEEIQTGSATGGVSTQLFQQRASAVADYVADLYEISPNAKFNLYTADYFPGLIQKILYANQIPESQYSIHLLSDGSYSASCFNNTYSGDNGQAVHDKLCAKWEADKQYCYENGDVPSDYSIKDSSSSMRAYAVLSSEGPRCEWDLVRKDLLTSGGLDFSSKAQNAVTQLSIASLLTELQQSGNDTVQAFKRLYSFNDEYFAEAEKQGKQVMLLLGAKVTSEANFEDYARLTELYYGDDNYLYYYKGHPGTPTDFYPQKQNELEKLGITDVDSSIAAELILFFYPDIYLSGYGSTTFQSAQKEMASGLWGQTKAKALASSTADYSIMDWFASPISDANDSRVKEICPSGHACYLVEFSDEILSSANYQIAIWDATDSQLRYYTENSDGSYSLVNEQGGGSSSNVSVDQGTYIIRSTLAAKYVLDAKSAGKNNGTNVQLYSSNMTNAQRWEISYDSNGYAIIKNVNSGKVLDVDKTSKNVQLWEDCGTENQRWIFSRGTNGSIVVSSVYDPDLHLTVSGGSAKSGANINVSASSKGIGFELLSYPAEVNTCEQVIEDGYYTLQPLASAMGLGDVVLDIESASSADKANAQLYTSNNSYAQIFKLEYDNGFYRIVNSSSGKVLTLDQGNVVAGTNVYQMTDSGADSQRWSVKESNNGSYLFINKASGLVLDVSGGKMKDEANVQGYTSNGTDAQKWVLAEVQGPQEALDTLAALNKDALPDGTYVIKSSLANKQVLDVKSASSDNKANVQLYESNMTGAQGWKVTHDDKGYITFTNEKSGKVLDVNAAKRDNGTNVQQYQSNDSYAQKWVAVDMGDGEYKIVSALWPTICLDIKSANSSNGANVQIYKDNGTDSQRFSFLSKDPNVEPGENLNLGDGWYSINSAIDKNYVLDVESASRDNGANVQLYKANSTYAQMFQFEFVPDGDGTGWYRIINGASAKALDITDGNVVPSTNIQQWNSSDTNQNQLFAAHKNADGTISFVSKSTGLTIDVASGKAKNNANVQGYTANGTKAQCFTLTKQTSFLIEGLFTIASSINSGKVLDVKSGSTSNGANVQIYDSNATFAQKWEIKKVEGQDNTFTIQSVVSGKYLAADASGNVCQRSQASDGSQYWVPSIKNGYTVLTNQKSGKVLDLASASTKNGANVQVYNSNGTDAQQWSIKSTDPIAAGTYYIRSAMSSSKVVDVKSGSSSNGANVQLYSKNNTGAQKWKVSKNSDGTYTFANAASGKALDVKSGKAVSGANVQIYTKNSSKAQKWKIQYASDGTFKIVSALDSGLVLDVSGASTKNGANIQIYQSNNSKTQRFTFEKTTYTPPLPSDQQAMLNKIKGKSSGTSYLIAVNRKTHKVGVFKGSKNNWKLQYYWSCVTGASGTPTITGTYRTTGFKRSSLSTDSRAIYCTQIWGGYFFHSILASNSELGKSLSHGCIRLAYSNANWIYKNIKVGTTVVIYN